MNADADSLWVGLDLGTQSVKAVIATETGKIRASGQHPLTSTRDAGRHEQNPTEWTDAAAAALAQATSQLSTAERGRIAGVSSCSTSGTVVVLDAHGSPTTPGLMYDDSRGAAFAPALRDAGTERWQKLGIVIQPSWALCRIAWLADTGHLPPGQSIAHQGDVLAQAMTSAPVPTDWSSALKSGYDVIERVWPPEVLAAASVHSSQLPEVVAPGTQIGTSSANWEQATGLPAGTPVFAGTTDGCAAQLGAGALAPGDWHTVVGTTLVIKGVTPRLISDGSGAVYSHRAPHGDLWFPGGASNVGAGALTTLFPEADLARLDAAIGERTGAIAPSYPLTRRGERFPFLSPDAHGFALLPHVFPCDTDLPSIRLSNSNPDSANTHSAGAPTTDPHGFAVPSADLPDASTAEASSTGSMGFRPLDALRSLPVEAGVESVWAGVACVERLCFDVLADQGAPLTGRLSSSGGGTRSTTWNRMRATLLNRPIALPETAEGSLGMAILARWGAGQAGLAEPHDLDRVASSMSRIRTVIDPDAAHTARLTETYAAFRDALTEKGWI